MSIALPKTLYASLFAVQRKIKCCLLTIMKQYLLTLVCNHTTQFIRISKLAYLPHPIAFTHNLSLPNEA